VTTPAVTDPFDRCDMTFEFPGGVKPFRAGDWFRNCTDIRVGSHVHFVRVADDCVEIHAATPSMNDRVEVYRCEAGRGHDHLVFIQLPRLSS
jgi:hypothetical protein